eukprot:scaffold120932_cov48-Phaeocystis_antarctica.AAC.2
MTREAAPLKYFRSHLTSHCAQPGGHSAISAQAFFVRENVKHSHARDPEAGSRNNRCGDPDHIAVLDVIAI